MIASTRQASTAWRGFFATEVDCGNGRRPPEFHGVFSRRIADIPPEFRGFLRVDRAASPCLCCNSGSTFREHRRPSIRFRLAHSSEHGGRIGRAIGANEEGKGHVNKLELVEHVAAATETSKAAAAAALDAVIEGITKALKKGEEVRLVGFGTFSVKKRAAGKGRNPATGEEIKIPASKSARFKSGATLKAALNK